MSGILWPLRRLDFSRLGIDTTTYVLRVTCNGVTTDLSYPSLTALRNYWMAGDAQADSDGGVGGIGDAVTLFQTMLRTHAQGASFAVTLSSTNRMTITCANNFSLLWTHANTTMAAATWGFALADTVSGTSTSGNQTMGAWMPVRPPSIDSRPKRQFAVAAAVSMSGRSRVSRMTIAANKRDLQYDLLLPRYALLEYTDPTEFYGNAEYMWMAALSLGRLIRYYEDETVRTILGYVPYFLRAEEVAAGDRESIIRRDQRFPWRWSVVLPLRGYS